MSALSTSFLLFALTTACSAQTIYSINGTVVRTNDQAWILDSGSGWYGLLQFMDRPSADSEWTTRTTVHFGTHSFTVRLPAVAVVVIGLISAASLILIATTVRGKIRKVHSHANAR